MRKYKSNPTQMGEALITLIAGGSLKITQFNGKPIDWMQLGAAGFGTQITNTGVYVSELDQRVSELFGFHITVKVDGSSIYLDRRDESGDLAKRGWTYFSDRHGRQQIHPHLYGPIVDRVLIDMLECSGENPIYFPIFSIDKEHHIPEMVNQEYVMVEHDRGYVRVFMDDLMDTAKLSGITLNTGVYDSDYVDTEHHQRTFTGDRYTGNAVNAVIKPVITLSQLAYIMNGTSK